MVTKKTDAPKRKRAAAKKPKRELALWEKLVAFGRTIPEEELDRLPTSSASDLHHYHRSGCGPEPRDE